MHQVRVGCAARSLPEAFQKMRGDGFDHEHLEGSLRLKSSMWQSRNDWDDLVDKWCDSPFESLDTIANCRHSLRVDNYEFRCESPFESLDTKVMEESELPVPSPLLTSNF